MKTTLPRVTLSSAVLQLMHLSYIQIKGNQAKFKFNLLGLRDLKSRYLPLLLLQQLIKNLWVLTPHLLPFLIHLSYFYLKISVSHDYGATLKHTLIHTTHARGHMMHGCAQAIHHVPRCMNCHKAIAVITGRAHCFHNIYIMLILLL